MTRYVVIGASGLVGRHVRQALAGRDVVATDRASLQLEDHRAVRELILTVRPTVLVLAAAEAWVERCEREPTATRAINVVAARAVADAADAVGATLVVFSSEYVFDGTRGSYVESDGVDPINEYGRQKVELERIALASRDAIVVRTSGVFGVEPRRRNFVLQLVDALRAKRHFAVATDQLITPTYAPALGAAVAELIDAGARGTYHVVGPEILGRWAFAGRVARVFGLDTSLLRGSATSELGLSAPRPLRAGLSDATLRKTIGHPLTSVDDALRELAAEGV